MEELITSPQRARRARATSHLAQTLAAGVFRGLNPILPTSTGDPGGCCSHVQDLCSNWFTEAHCRIGAGPSLMCLSAKRIFIFTSPPVRTPSSGPRKQLFSSAPAPRCFTLRVLGHRPPGLYQSLCNQKLAHSFPSLPCQPPLSADHLLGGCQLEHDTTAQLKLPLAAFLTL